jgi:hypothetical protein
MINYIWAGTAGALLVLGLIALMVTGSDNEAARITKHCEQRGAFYVKDIKYECSKAQ